jgi:hypothetical protein
MLEFLKKKWVEWLISITIVIITAALYNSLTIKRESNSLIQQELKQKASVEYVNQQDAGIKAYVDKQDDNTNKKIDESVKAQTELIKSIDGKLNILINKR